MKTKPQKSTREISLSKLTILQQSFIKGGNKSNENDDEGQKPLGGGPKDK